jgi:hypothetical protein
MANLPPGFKTFFAFEHERKYFFLGENLLTNYEP